MRTYLTVVESVVAADAAILQFNLYRAIMATHFAEKCRILFGSASQDVRYGKQNRLQDHLFHFILLLRIDFHSLGLLATNTKNCLTYSTVGHTKQFSIPSE